jgi:predicted ATPase
MLEHLKLHHLGPADQLDFAFGPRINVLTGDNGLGKTFVLDLAWWALTRTWADGRVVHPAPDLKEAACVEYHVYGKGGSNTPVVCNYRREELDWSLPRRRPPSPGFILYARIDGGFSLWDPERNYSHEKPADPRNPADRPDSFQFAKRQLWEGLKDEAGRLICRGLLEDWETWRLKGNGAFVLMTEVLRGLSPGGREGLLRPGDPVRLPDSGAREIPTLVLPYGRVPIHQTSAGIRRILSLAYMIVWAWTEHKVAAGLRGREQAKRIVLLWDEVEAHLHPQWQRTILPSVVGVLQRLLKETDGTELQVLATTHAPLVLASLETLFDPANDKLFNLELDKAGKVRLETVPWAIQGDVVDWLLSPAFDMRSGYSREAERALEAAQSWLAGRIDQLSGDLKTREQIDAELRRVLAAHDPFWPRWSVRMGGAQ